MTQQEIANTIYDHIIEVLQAHNIPHTKAPYGIIMLKIINYTSYGTNERVITVRDDTINLELFDVDTGVGINIKTYKTIELNDPASLDEATILDLIRLSQK